MQTKAGIKTTEGIITLVVVVLNSIVASGALDDSPTALRIVSAIVAGAAAVGYTIARSYVKGSK